MKTMLPNYENNVANVSNSILKYFNIETSHSTLNELDDILNKHNYKNVVLVLFDGLGYNILKRNGKLCPFLNKYLVSSLSSTFPSTTMSARTSIESGLHPIEHGWLGWDMYFKEFDEVITLSRNCVKSTKEKITDYHIGRTLLKYESVVDKIKKDKDCYAKKISVYHDDRNMSLKKARMQIQEILENDKRNYIYFYCNQPDHNFHTFGNDSILSKMLLRKLDKEFKKLCTSLNDTLVIAIADHGHLACKYITLTDYPNIIEMLEGDIGIDVRAASFRVKEEYMSIFPGELKMILKDDFIILSKDEVREQKLYGEGEENKYFEDALGDYFAIGITDKCIRYDRKKHTQKSSHSGITEDEMLVPLVVYEVIGGKGE
ncbi:MAG: alkaline phosphatase family protein [Erysipelotrichales bacterium]|nr:alkaline phosphatase family protein [Erysipelotrichales bacterium]